MIIFHLSFDISHFHREQRETVFRDPLIKWQMKDSNDKWKMMLDRTEE